jgi:pimeloyl-ACP methyl ester carboxylesterase
MKVLAFFFALIAPLNALAAEEAATLKTSMGTLHGTLLVPKGKKQVPVVLLISGSGPTDRDGNSVALPGKNDSLKMLAEGLAARGIASLRYDKRGIGESRGVGPEEKDLRFEMYVDDAAAWAAKLKRDRRFSRVVIAGHSEGALIGTIAAQRGAAAALVSIAGVGRPADVVLRMQLIGRLPPDLRGISDRTLDALKSGKTVDDVPQSLSMLYRPSVQPYLISWFRYDPAAEIAKLTIPVLIVQGTTDIQVTIDDARALAAAKPDAKLELVEGMNHVLKMVGDSSRQIASYSDPALPVASRLVEVITIFAVGRRQ